GVEDLETAPRSDPLINKIVVYPEIIPIIFVPGIMGSRLVITENQDKAWDPDALGFMGYRYGVRGTPEKRKSILVGQSVHISDHLTVDNNNKKAPSDKAAFDWGSVAWRFYKGILNAISSHQWPFPLNICFKFPVYAFGYNWTDSNHASGRKLAEYIETVIATHTWTTCRRVILVTHSMGGLVARAACKLHGAESRVVGIVHGTQPTTGSPAAYQRMKQGFRDLHRTAWDWLISPLESIKNKVGERVLGPNGQSVTIVMANMPGGLELLPNQLYRTNDGKAQWLTYNLSNGRRVELPEKDPYREIYAKQHEAFRLVNPVWLGKIDDEYGYNQKVEDPWNAYAENLKLAKEFHQDLEDYCHEETYQFYSTGLNTADTVTIASRKYSAQDLAVKHYSQGKTFFEILDETGNMVDPHALWMEHAPYIYGNTPPPASSARKKLYAFAIEPPTGSGDGTVPDSSAQALDAKPESYTKGPDGTVDINEKDESGAKREHSSVFNSRTAQQITLKAIENLCKHVFNKQTAH
ncbi:MAG: alpha/beta fold hydrolase, partial [Desulfatitalea sp.]|nr:alpha/beta fold hydrolase [Desulfatitalea sp.]